MVYYWYKAYKVSDYIMNKLFLTYQDFETTPILGKLLLGYTELVYCWF